MEVLVLSYISLSFFIPKKWINEDHIFATLQASPDKSDDFITLVGVMKFGLNFSGRSRALLKYCHFYTKLTVFAPKHSILTGVI